MDIEHEQSIHSSNDDKSCSPEFDLSWSSTSSVTNNLTRKSFFTIIDTNISIDTEIDAIINLWVNIFKKDPKTGTIQLFTIVMNCLDIDVCYSSFTNLNSIIMFKKIMNWLKIMEDAGSLLSSVTVKKSSDIQKTLQFVCSVFHYHMNLFFLKDTQKSYFIFLRDILIKISQSNFIGPRLLATQLGLKIITGLLLSNNLRLVHNDFIFLLKEFFIKRWKDTSCVVRETVLLELKLWIQIDFIYFLNDFWMYIYWALGDRSFAIQIIALELSKNVLDMHSDVTTVKLLVKKIIIVLPNMLLSKNDDVVISAFSLYISLSSVVEEDDQEQCLSKINSITYELIFSENSKIARFSAKYFVDTMVNSQPDKTEQIKIILCLLRGIPSQMTTVAIAFFANAIYDFCPLLTDFKLISQVLSLENCIKDNDKYNLIHLLTHIVQQLITGMKPEPELANIGDKNDITQLHTNKLKKKEFTCFLSVYLINELKDCKEPTYAFSIWTLIQFIDFKLLQDKMMLPEIFLHASLFYDTWNIPTILEIISKCINIISDMKGFEQNLSLQCTKDIAKININILRSGVENSPRDIPSLLIQKNALIKIWTLAKHNSIPDDLEPLKYLSYYVPNLNTTQNNLIISEYALSAYMEILRKKLSNVPVEQNLNSIEQSLEITVEHTFTTFIDSLFDILHNYDIQLLNICETAFLVINELLQIKSTTDKTNYELNDNQNRKLTHFVICVCKNYEGNNDLNTLKIIEVYIQLIKDGIINMNHLVNLLQFVKMELFEHALRPLINFFCKKETGNELSHVINLYLVYTFENIILQKSDFKNSTVKDVINVATIISRILCQCTDQIGKRLIATSIHRRGIQYAMNDTFKNPYSDYPFKQFFWILTSMCHILIPHDAQRLADNLLNKPSTQELISSENEHILNYLYKLQEVCDTGEN